MSEATGEEVLTREAIGGGKRVLYIPDDFGIRKPGDSRYLIMAPQTPEEEAQEVRVFEKAGYEIIRDGEFDDSNNNALGINAHKETPDDVPEKLGLPVPEKLSIKDALRSSAPIVVKMRGSQRGEAKYLLETEDQKKRFIAFCKMHDFWFSSMKEDFNLKDAQLNALAMISQILYNQGPSSIDYEGLDPYKEWNFERYIGTPSGFNTSFRVLVDGYGHIHYSQINRSERGEAPLLEQNSEQHVPFFEELHLGDHKTTLLTHPRSPLFLGGRNFVSNISQGGSRVMLDGKKIEDETDRQVLIAHGINPDNPRLPSKLRDMAQRIGVASRSEYPYFGVDFIQDEKGKYYYLETNPNPMLNPGPLNLPETSTPQERIIAMVQRIVK